MEIKVLKNVTRYRIGKKEFKSSWGAWCALAKAELLEELNQEYSKLMKDTETDVLDFDDFGAAYTNLFKQKYPHHYPGVKSSFRKAVEERARELKIKAFEEGVII